MEAAGADRRPRTPEGSHVNLDGSIPAEGVRGPARPGRAPITGEALEELRSAYGRWWDLLQSGGRGWPPDERQCERVLTALHPFGGAHEGTPASVAGVITALAKGKELIETALLWAEPVVGGRGTETDRDRGAQWRLVIAWSGLENIINATCKQGVAGPVIDRFVRCCAPSDYPPLDAPNRRLKKLEQWLCSEDDGGPGIREFLGFTGKDVRHAIGEWMIVGTAVRSWTESMILAKAFRHASAHGALSASKVRDWGLRPALDRLVPEIGLVAASAFRRLTGGGADDWATRSNRARDGRMLALSMRQPHAEAVIRGTKTVNRRTRSTKVRGRVYVYASYPRCPADEETAAMVEYGLSETSCDGLPRGVVIGTVELFDCTVTEEGYLWCFRDAERAKRLRTPERPPRSSWFAPF